MFFRLLPEVYLITGTKKSLLQNILSKKSLWIDDDLTSLIRLCEENKVVPEEFEEKVKILAFNNWGIITDHPVFIDKLRLHNIFNDKRFFKDTPYIRSATLRITNECNLNCSNCSKTFCPTCFKSDSIENDMTLSDWENVILKLDMFGCKNILLTGGECTLHPKFKNICEFITNLNINLTICTNGTVKIDKDIKNLSIVIHVLENKNITEIVKNFRDFKNVMLINCNLSKYQKSKIIPSNWTVVDTSVNAPIIQKGKLVNMDIFNFFLRKDRNKCLNEKIAILENGDVYPCLGAYISNINLNEKCNNYDFDEDVINAKKAGNVKREEWADIMKKLMKNFWHNKIDLNNKCNACEFRYACDSCLFNNIEENCHYNQEEAIWR